MAESALPGLATAANVVTTGLGVLGKGLEKAVSIGETFISASFSMSKAATSGAAGLTDMGSAVGQVASLIPVLGAAFSSVLNTAIATLEKNITTQQTLSNVGATFGGNLKDLRETVNSTYLSMDQYAKVVSSNGDVLASFKGGVEGGTKAFSNVLTSLQNGPETGKMLANLGIGFEEGATLTAQFMRGLGSMNRTGQMSADQLAKATADYAVELTGLSQLTGQSRKELAEKVNEELAEAQFQNFLNTLDDKEAAKLREAVAQEYAVSGKAGADALKASAAGFPPMTRASQMFTATQEASVERQRELMNKIKDSSVDLDTFRAQSKTLLANSLEGMREDQKRISTAAMAGVLAGGSELATSIARVTQFVNASYGKSAADIEEITKKIRLTAPQTSDATTGIGQMKDIINQSNDVLKALQPTFNEALEAGISISKTMNSVAKTIADRLPGIIGFVKESAEALKNKANADIKDKLDPSKFSKYLGEFMDAVGDKTKTVVKAVSGDKDAQNKLFNDMKAGWDSVMKHIKDSIPSLNSILFGGPPTPGGVNTPGGESGAAGKSLIDKLEEIRVSLKAAVENSILPGAPSAAPAPPTPRAEGGPVSSGQTYLVGEDGPELLTAGSSGNVISNDKLTTILSAISDQNDMGESIDQLNNTNSQMLAAIRDLIDVSKRTLTATKGLNGNLFAA
jgi:hypothetical protein